MSLEQSVSTHYGQIDLSNIGPDDEFHIGRAPATAELLGMLNLQPGAHVLDAGCGTGGAARIAAKLFNVNVTGIDLTPEFIAKANNLGGGKFVQGSVLDMDFDDHVFDAAYTIHVGMNIRDKKSFYREVARTLKPGGMFGIYDVMGSEPLAYPLPWAARAEESFPVSVDDMRGLLHGAGFEIVSEKDWTAPGIESLKLRPGGSVKVANLIANLESGKCAAYMMLARLKA